MDSFAATPWCCAFIAAIVCSWLPDVSAGSVENQFLRPRPHRQRIVRQNETDWSRCQRQSWTQLLRLANHNHGLLAAALHHMPVTAQTHRFPGVGRTSHALHILGGQLDLHNGHSSMQQIGEQLIGFAVKPRLLPRETDPAIQKRSRRLRWRQSRYTGLNK